MVKGLAMLAMLLLLFGPRTPHQQNTQPHTAESKTNQDQKVVPPVGAVGNPSVPSPNCQPTTTAEQKAPKDKPLPWPIRLDWVIVWVTIAYVIVTWLTLRTIKHQSDTMDRQATEGRESAKETIEIARKSAEAAVKAVEVSANQLRIYDAQLRQVESQTRPWIGLDTDNGLQTAPLSIDGEGNISMNIAITARNYGLYPGQNVIAGADLIVTNTLDDVHAEEERIWSSRIPEKAGSVVFPGLSRVRWQWGASVGREALARYPSDTQLLAFVVGCIWYRDQFGKPHYTVFSYQLKTPRSILSVAFDPSPNTTVNGQWVECYGFVDPPEKRETNQPA